jgi:O-antigen/teichoic acid export membrane protein
LVLSALVFAGAQLWMMLAARAGILLLLVAVQHLWVRQEGGGVERAPVPAGELARFMRFGFPMIPASFIWVLIMGVDRFMLEHYGRLADVGVYHVADVLAAFLINGTRPINGMLQPRFANLLEQSPDEIGFYLRKAFKYLALLLFPGAVGLAVAAEPLVALVSTDEFAAAASMLPVLAGAYVLIGLSNPLYHLVFLRHGGRAFLWLYPLCLAANVGLNVALIPQMGGLGAAWATLAGFGVYVLGLLAMSERSHLKAALGEIQTLAAVLGCSLAMGLAMYGLRQAHPLLGGVVLVPLGFVIYALLVRLIGLVSLEERSLLMAPLQPVFSALRSRWRVLH